MYKIILAVFLFVSAFVITVYETDDNTSEVVLNLPAYEELDREQQRQIDCLAINMYREAGIEKEDGIIAVGLVTMNRVKSGVFPQTVCQVVKQKTRSTCQFSWNCIKYLPRIDEQIYRNIRELAIRVFFNHHLLEDFTYGALFYHADYVNPRWKRLEVTTQIGRHIFYKPLEKL
jgi:spore germination cell wall hydrolase CwlJ-like protein